MSQPQQNDDYDTNDPNEFCFSQSSVFPTNPPKRTPPKSFSDQIIPLKLQLTSMNQQLLSAILLSSSNNNNNNNINNESIISNPQQQIQQLQLMNPIEMVKIITQLEQCCDQFIQSEFEFKESRKDFDISYERRELHLNQSKTDLHHQINLREQNLDRREFELNKRELALQQREFELNKRELNQNIEKTNNKEQISSSIDGSNNCIISSTTPSLFTNEQPPLQIETILDSFQQLHEDYQSMKFLVDRSITTQQTLHHQSTQLSQHIQQVVHIKTDLTSELSKIEQSETKLKKIDAIEIQLNNLETAFALNESKKQEKQRIRKAIENQRVEVPKILQQNRSFSQSLRSNGQVYICFQFQNLPGVQMSCVDWSGHYGQDFHSLFHSFFSYLRTDLQPHQSKLQSSTSKLYLSSKSVLNGEWIQIQGEGTIIQMTSYKLFDFIKPGDNDVDYSTYPCSKNCQNCLNYGGHLNHSTQQLSIKRFLIKFKWE